MVTESASARPVGETVIGKPTEPLAGNYQCGEHEIAGRKIDNTVRHSYNGDGFDCTTMLARLAMPMGIGDSSLLRVESLMRGRDKRCDLGHKFYRQFCPLRQAARRDAP
jgi:hypothetical protein